MVKARKRLPITARKVGRPKKVVKIIEPVELRWRYHAGNIYRVWRTDWFGDQFELVVSKDLIQLEDFCKKFCIPFKEQVEED